ncbi:MAG: GTP cyclohydrolase I FolE [Candidatus Limnocylindrales bacterium]
MPERPPARASERLNELSDHVRQLIAEIEAGEDEGPALGPRGSEGPESVAAPGERAVPERDADGRIEHAVRQILTEIGEDAEREGLVRTPERMHRMWLELTCGYQVDPDRLINGAVFDVGYSEMVVVRDIEFYSLCEHHMLPFFGIASVGYLPRGRVLGLSKIPRIVEMYARRLQVQERLTQQIADFLQERLDPLGVGVVIEAQHLCMAMRGVRTHGATMVTSSVLGLFRSSQRTRDEFMAHLERHDRSRLG